ncbi:MAG TPA: EF-hand domain-containing protein [Phenylobacterium sp.]|nr:EF-hand domain-containing protein [Phenylobacterium sp.]
MHISSHSNAYGGGEAHRLLSALLQGATGARQKGTSAATGDTPPDGADAPAAPPPGPPPSSGANQFALGTLKSLISAQESPPSSSDLAGQIIKAADGDGDGSLSADEIGKALGVSSSDKLTQAVGKLDTDGDGKLSASELTSALDSRKAHHGRHHGLAQSSSELAAQLIKKVDTDGDGSVSQDEIKSVLGDAASGDAFATAFGKLDGDSDGKLSASELASAIDTFRTAHFGGGASTPAAQASVTA